jgi:hypothetical protein
MEERQAVLAALFFCFLELEIITARREIFS